MSRRNLLLLLAVTLVTLTVSVAWQQYCAPRISEAEQRLKASTWLSVLPPGS